MFISLFIHDHLKEAWESGWQSRRLSGGLKMEDIVLKKKADRSVFIKTLMDEIDSMEQAATQPPVRIDLPGDPPTGKKHDPDVF